MDEQSKKILEETLELTKDNHLMLKRIRRSQKNAQLMRGLYWIFIIAISFGGYYLIGPYLSKISSLYSGIYNNANTLQNLDTSSIQGIQDFFKGNSQPK